MKQTSKSRGSSPAAKQAVEAPGNRHRRNRKRLSKRVKRPKNIWGPEEDAKLLELIDLYGPSRWSMIASFMPGREGKQCRERWHNHLNPHIMKDSWSEEEDLRLFLLYKLYGSKWSVLSFMFSGRTDNSIKNHWNSIMKKKVRRFETYLRGVVESGNFAGLDPLDVDLIHRIKRAEFDNKNSRKGRTRDYAGFFKKNGLTQFVRASDPQAVQDDPVVRETLMAPESVLQELVGGMQVTEHRHALAPVTRRLMEDQHSIVGGPAEPQTAEKHPRSSFRAARMVIKENLDLMAGKVEILASKISFTDFGVSAAKAHPKRSTLEHLEFKTDAKQPVFSSRVFAELTPNSLLSKDDRDCHLQTTANCAKNDLLPDCREPITSLCFNTFFAARDGPSAPSPMPLQANQSVYSSEPSQANCFAHFRALLTPTKRVLDLSNRKFLNSRSSAKAASVFSNLKSLDISKSLEYY